ncbi:hypothetical protein O9G_005218 [Rozella allomycis CSF55]|uniref:CBF1-interacting co-repressor CIR N-terminal domain-containing protein n=1 Tax=Rozella allomycis (strain CSF55) TaxID=988480 RepID=A0A075AMR9_ROZAC|nr:hypothetical protein O9G_005218 [Rozella allomycis CSF55]|eukprot:EPZ30953.1 hypothetical protein O9G_005218 [Rozella allomycis CSF55]
MGGGDLNLKKSWHPGTYKNMEDVWKREQKLEKEYQKALQVAKEMEEQRKAEEYKRLQEEAGLIERRPDRLEWMYSGQGVNSQQLNEEYLLGKRRVDEDIETAPLLKEVENAGGALLLGTINANTERDLEAKMREDPLFAIKKREMMAIQKLMNNPAKVKELKVKMGKSEKGKKDRHSHKDEAPEKDPYRNRVRSRSRSPRNNRYSNNGRYSRDRSRSPQYRRSREEGRHRDSRQKRSMTEEEKRKKLEEMQKDAEWNEKARLERINSYKMKDERQVKVDNDSGSRDANKFIRNLEKEASASYETLEKRIHSHKGKILKD